MNKMEASDSLKGAAVQVQSWVQLLVFPVSDILIKKMGGTIVAMEVCARYLGSFS